MFKKFLNELIEQLYFKQPGNLALYDQLTEVYNYNWLHHIAASKYFHKEVFITVIDVNNFKQINDKEGNIMLQDIAKQLMQLKSFDSSIEVARYGGDEFVIISKFDISSLIEMINEKKKLVSYGICKKYAGQHITVAFIKADDAMYRYKMDLKNKQNKHKKFKTVGA